MRIFLEVEIAATEFEREILLPDLVELGCEGFQDTETYLLCYFDKTHWDPAAYEQFKTSLHSILVKLQVDAEIRFSEIKERNWNEEWEQTLKPIEIGDRLVIKPSWSAYNNSSNRIIVQIDPKMAFGTGYHESTRLLISLIERYTLPGESILDVGTGTGILAITAVKLGAKSGMAIDIDPWAVENARENILLNGVEAGIIISDAALTSLEHWSFDSVYANITLVTIEELINEFHRVLRIGGKLFISGILTSDRGRALTLLNSSGFRYLADSRENEWIAIAATKL